MSSSLDTSARSRSKSTKPIYRPAIGPKLRKLYHVVLILLALLGANAAYLSSITFLGWWTGASYESQFYLFMILAHIFLGLLIIVPFLIFGVRHLGNTKARKNRRAVNVGYALFFICIVVLISGLLLVRFGELFELKSAWARSLTYWLHVITPLVGCWLYWLHRLVGPPMKKKIGWGYLAFVILAVGIMVTLHVQDPRKWNQVGPASGMQYFEPSLTRTSSGNFIPANVLMQDQYCKACHEDVHKDWATSSHHFSSFNNPVYLASVRETREVVLKRDGSIKASRWCAGCHDPVPFLSGAFDDPEFDDVEHATAHAGVTCTVCHAITHINSTKGNGDYTIEEPIHYPFAFSENSMLQWLNHQLILAKPGFHKKTFLKPLHKTTEFCSVCHKVHLPYELTHYKEFLRGQNHYDTFLLSGVSGISARSFYYPEKADTNCNRCHMPFRASEDFAAQQFPGADQRSIHDHFFPGANTGLNWLKHDEQAIKRQQELLKDCARVDIFGIREQGSIEGTLHAPLRPNILTLKPGEKYLLEVVIRTTKMGHHLTEGTADSNELWLDVELKSGKQIIGRSGALDEEGKIDPWSHFVNSFVVDKEGNRIERRNPQDIFVTLYNHQIPPGAAWTVHYEFEVPEGLTEPLSIDVKLNHRKFESELMKFVTRSAREGDLPIRGNEDRNWKQNRLPITLMSEDQIQLPILGQMQTVKNADSTIPEWERWNDFGIGLLIKGKAELRQAVAAFQQVESFNRYDGPLNLARAYFREGRLNETVAAVSRASQMKNPAPPSWTMAYLSGLANRQLNELEKAENNFRQILEATDEEQKKRGFDFSKDYEIINLLGMTLFDQARQLRGENRKELKRLKLLAAAKQFHHTLKIDAENLTAHYNLGLIYQLLGHENLAKTYQKNHQRYKPDDNASELAVKKAREKYPAANHAAEALVIYPLQRRGAPGYPNKE